MKLNLTFKLFSVFLITALTIVVFMILTMNFFVFRNFSDYVSRVELKKMEPFIESLKTEYSKNGSWKTISDKPFIFMEKYRTSMLGEDFPAEAFFEHIPPPKPGSKPEMKMKPRPGDFREPPFGGGPPHPPEPREFNGQGPDASPDGFPKHHERPIDPATGEILRTISRLALFDSEKQAVIHKNIKPEAYTLSAVEVNGATVGWLGLRNEKRLSNPLDVEFLRQQEKAFYLIGAIILLLTAGISYLLARHLLAPIRQIAKGTRALASFKFDTKIIVKSKDELGQLARDFNRMAETLKRYEEMRRQWITDISHELRTPVAILRGEIEAVQDGIRKPDAATLDSFHSEALRLHHLVDDLHLITLADSGNLDIRQDDVTPVRILKRTVNRFRPRFEREKIRLELDAPDTLENIIVTGDEDRLERLFGNLLENTLRYTDSPGNLSVRLDAKGNNLLMVFEDSAPGVPDESLPCLFDRLYRVDKSRSRQLGGSGLGLSICKEIVETHGGSIQADHAGAGGLKIRILIPSSRK